MKSLAQADLFDEAAATQAEHRRDVGIERAVTHADAEIPGWSDQADSALVQFVAIRNGRPFLTEDFVAWAMNWIAAPPDPRSWGGPVRRAAIKGVIERIGYAPANTSNRSPKALWRGRA